MKPELKATVRWREVEGEGTGYVIVDCYKQETLENVILNALESVKNKTPIYASELTVKRVS